MKLCSHHRCLSSRAFLSLQRKPHVRETSVRPPLSTQSLAATRCGLCLCASACSGNFLSGGSCSTQPLLPSLFHLASCISVLSQLLGEPFVASLGDGAGLGGGGRDFGWTQHCRAGSAAPPALLGWCWDANCFSSDKCLQNPFQVSFHSGGNHNLLSLSLCLFHFFP